MSQLLPPYSSKTTSPDPRGGFGDIAANPEESAPLTMINPLRPQLPRTGPIQALMGLQNF